jgi:hypothetical protein
VADFEQHTGRGVVGDDVSDEPGILAILQHDAVPAMVIDGHAGQVDFVDPFRTDAVAAFLRPDAEIASVTRPGRALLSRGVLP